MILLMFGSIPCIDESFVTTLSEFGFPRQTFVKEPQTPSVWRLPARTKHTQAPSL